jgi:hypothetical protein
LIDLYDDADAPSTIPKPRVPPSDIGVKRWHHDLWIKIVEAAIDDNPDKVVIDWHPAFLKPAALRYATSSPALLAWVKKWNDGKPYEAQIRPFGFLLSYTPKSGLSAKVPMIEDAETPRRGRPRKVAKAKPIAPYSKDIGRAVRGAFCRVSGNGVEPEQLKTYAEALQQYHVSPEAKFENGDYLDRGRTERRHIVATEFVLIGKEANRVGDSGEPDPISPPVAAFTRTR